ncbi:MAG: hypothetical protein KDD38_02570 [Bdellovibrionales bacterium]|nr:hypothetical protein [Bdellovibrionales bacterium]
MKNHHLLQITILAITLIYFAACSSAPKFDQTLVRPWQSQLENESPSERPYIAVHKAHSYELIYLAANHDNDPNSDTLRLVGKLFNEFNFNAIVIEPIAYSYGKSPKWFLDEAHKGVHPNIIIGGESSLAAIQADDKKIPFYGGEIDHKALYNQLKAENYTDSDILGFYLARQIPQWVREKENRKDLITKKGLNFITHYCKVFEIPETSCPSLNEIKTWYKTKTGKTLTSDLNTEDVAPIYSSPLFLHQISSSIGTIRDRFTLDIIQQLLAKHKRVAVVYGGSHYITLKKSFEKSMGRSKQIIFP